MSRRVLITGASSGLGAEMARQLGQEGCRVALTGRRRDKLEAAGAACKAAGASDVLLLAGSASERETVKAHYAEIKAKWGGLDWAILNAGVGDSKNAKEFSAENYRWTFETNVFGVCEWMEAVLPDMLAAKSGTIAPVSSLAGFRGMPNSGAYGASKAALNSLLESTRVDLIGTGVKVVTVCPGFVKSELTARNEGGMPFLLETEDGARRIIEGVRAGRRVVHFPWQLSLLVKYVVPNLPAPLFELLVRRVRRAKKPYVDESLTAK